jgi:hypothetical protein
VWPENYSANSAQKVWAVKFAARHPHIALLDLSSFKCGHDAPTYGIVESIVSANGTPYAALHDIDANKPGGSIKIRVKTYAHSLKLHEEGLEDEGRSATRWRAPSTRSGWSCCGLKRAQLAARRVKRPGPGGEIERLAARLAAYVAPERPAESPQGLIQLRKKTEGGMVSVGG